MDDSSDRSGAQWNASPSSKAKNAIQRSVTALLDELAPERVLTRSEKLPDAIEQYRTPTGCVLQAADHALSVSWFPDPDTNAPLGQLQVLVFRGRVTRRGIRPNAKGAEITAKLVLLPVEPPAEDTWQLVGGTQYNTASLAAKCVELLQAEIQGAKTTP